MTARAGRAASMNPPTPDVAAWLPAWEWAGSEHRRNHVRSPSARDGIKETDGQAVQRSALGAGRNTKSLFQGADGPQQTEGTSRE